MSYTRKELVAKLLEAKKLLDEVQAELVNEEPTATTTTKEGSQMSPEMCELIGKTTPREAVISEDAIFAVAENSAKSSLMRKVSEAEKRPLPVEEEYTDADFEEADHLWRGEYLDPDEKK